MNFRFVRDDASLEQFLMEDPAVVHKRLEMEKRRLALTGAASALGVIQVVTPSVKPVERGDSTASTTSGANSANSDLKSITIVIPSSSHGLGLAIAEDTNEGSALRVQGFRNTPDAPSAGQKAGMLVEDIIDQINGSHPTSTEDMKKILAGCAKGGQVTLGILRKK